MSETSSTRRHRGWNFRRNVTLECPTCGRRKEALPDPSDPPRTTLVRAVCDRCPDDAALVSYFDAYGNQINDRGRPIT